MLNELKFVKHCAVLYLDDTSSKNLPIVVDRRHFLKRHDNSERKDVALFQARRRSSERVQAGHHYLQRWHRHIGRRSAGLSVYITTGGIPKYFQSVAGNCSPGSSRLYRLGDSQAQKAKMFGDERPRLRAS